MAQLNDEEALAILNQLDWDDNEQFKVGSFEQDDEAEGTHDHEGLEKYGDIDDGETEKEDCSLVAVMQEIIRATNERDAQVPDIGTQDSSITPATDTLSTEAPSGTKLAAKIALSDLQRWILQENQDERCRDDEKEEDRPTDSAVLPASPSGAASAEPSLPTAELTYTSSVSAPAPAPASAAFLSQRDREIDQLIAEERIRAELASCELAAEFDKQD